MNTLSFARWSRRCLLVVALLIAQHAGTLHALSHLFDKGDAAPGHGTHACCAVYQGLDHAPTAVAPEVVPVATAPRRDFPQPRFAPRQAAATLYDSRAPPVAT